jgi:hypothetical protein
MLRIDDERRLPRGPPRPLSPTNSCVPHRIAKAPISLKGPLTSGFGLPC